jgi:hypothetical protein
VQLFDINCALIVQFIDISLQLPSDTSAPIIIYTGDILDETSTFKILAEGIEICSPIDLIQAVVCLMAAYYIFNIEYPQQVKLSLLFIQRELLDIVEEGQVVPKSLLSLVQKMNSLQ